MWTAPSVFPLRRRRFRVRAMVKAAALCLRVNLCGRHAKKRRKCFLEGCLSPWVMSGGGGRGSHPQMFLLVFRSASALYPAVCVADNKKIGCCRLVCRDFACDLCMVGRPRYLLVVAPGNSRCVYRPQLIILPPLWGHGKASQQAVLLANSREWLWWGTPHCPAVPFGSTRKKARPDVPAAGICELSAVVCTGDCVCASLSVPPFRVADLPPLLVSSAHVVSRPDGDGRDEERLRNDNGAVFSPFIGNSSPYGIKMKTQKKHT